MHKVWRNLPFEDDAPRRRAESALGSDEAVLPETWAMKRWI